MNSEHCVARWEYVHMKDLDGFLKEFKIFKQSIKHERSVVRVCTKSHEEDAWHKLWKKCISCWDFWVTKNCDDDAEES